MNKVSFILAIHNHQPVGNFEYIMEEAFSKAYLPFLKTLERYPEIKVVLHYCGILYSFFLKRHPEFIDLLASFVQRGQVEILTGGFYEPILPCLPEIDGIGQVGKMTDFIRGHLGYEPKGAWIAERVWEPHLPSLLRKAGISYTTLDDFHFKLSGLRDEDLNGYYITDDGEVTIGIFPGSERLRYLVPFRPPEETIGFLSERASKGDVAITMADDGEKFGVWPETHRSVYEEGWLDRFFGLLQENNWIETTTFSEYWSKNPPLGRVYLPTTSYREMGEWALPPEAISEYEDVLGRLGDLVGIDRARTLLRGGFWRNFLSKYPESNNLHKKMLHVSKKVHEAIEKSKVKGPRVREPKRGLSPELKTQGLLNELWMGQCNDAYWHGIFGGLYLPHLRRSLYEHLIRAEVMADSFLHKGKVWLDAEEKDIDLDTHLEIIIGSPLMSLYIDPKEGGSLFEWDFRPKAFNLIDTFTRRKEGYHSKIWQASKESFSLKTIHERMVVKEEGLDRYLYYDRYRRVSLLDHFLPSATSFISFKNGEYQEEGDFISSPYSSAIKEEGRGLIVSLKREGRVNQYPLNLEKNLIIKPDKAVIDIEYNLTGDRIGDLLFGVEFNLALSGNGMDRYLRIIGAEPAESEIAIPREFFSVMAIEIVDEWLGIKIVLRTEPEIDLWYFPLETVSQSEGGLERVYQHSVFLPHWRLNNYTWKGKIVISVEDLNR